MSKKYTPVKMILAAGLLIGLILLLVASFAGAFGRALSNGWELRQAVVFESGYILAAASLVSLMWFLRPKKAAGLAAMLAVFQCLVIYFWYETAGTMKIIPSTNYYDMQASAFLHGQLALLETPASELQNLPDPYDPLQNAPYRLHDAAYYKGKYYLYWGPFPAMILAVPKLLFGSNISDSVLVLLFMSGYIVFLALNLTIIKTAYFPALPGWAYVSAIMVGGLMNPTLWLLARPWVYEAAISGGQCCTLGGTYFAFSALREKSIQPMKLVISGTLLACAVLSRISLALAIVWVAACIAYQIHNQTRPFRQSLKALLSFGVPLAVIGLMFFSYNFLRFDSPFEIGMKYTLGGMNTKKIFEDGFVTSPGNIRPNLDAYLFSRTMKLPQFPFLIAPLFGYADVEAAMNSHGLQTYAVSENIAGMMRTSPVFYCLAAQVLFGVIRFCYRKALAGVPALKRKGFVVVGPPDRTGWLSLLFAGFAVLAFFPLSLEFTSSMRYLFDFVPALFLLMYVRLAHLHSIIDASIEKIVWGIAVPVLSLITIRYGLLLGITSYYEYFSIKNPALYDQLIRAFSIFNGGFPP